MRIKVLDRILVSFAGLLLLLCGLCVFTLGLGVCPIQLDTVALMAQMTTWQRVIVVAVALVLIVLGLNAVMLLFRSRREKGFIMQHTEFGDMSISMQAMESMVKKVVDTHDELKVSSINIHNTRDGIVVDIRILLANGVNIPLTVNALQKQIKHYITSCSGVDVKEIRVMVETNHQLHKGKDEAVYDMLKADATAATEAANVADAISEGTQSVVGEAEDKKNEKPAIHQRIFSHADQPQIVPMPPEMEKTEDEPAQEIAQIQEQAIEQTEEQSLDIDDDAPIDQPMIDDATEHKASDSNEEEQ